MLTYNGGSSITGRLFRWEVVEYTLGLNMGWGGPWKLQQTEVGLWSIFMITGWQTLVWASTNANLFNTAYQQSQNLLPRFTTCTSLHPTKLLWSPASGCVVSCVVSFWHLAGSVGDLRRSRRPAARSLALLLHVLVIVTSLTCIMHHAQQGGFKVHTTS